MKIDVTQAHIDAGKKGSTVSCPIALAINEQLKPFPLALVTKSGDAAFLEFGEYCIRSVRAGWFIHKFDKGLPVQPFTLNIEP